MHGLKTILGMLAALMAALLLVSTLAYAAGGRSPASHTAAVPPRSDGVGAAGDRDPAGQQAERTHAAGVPLPMPPMANATTRAPAPPFVQNDLAPSDPAALSAALSYYFIAGNTFTPDYDMQFFRQAIGCVNQMPLGSGFSAPVHLPQGSQVVTITLYTYDNVLTTTVSTAYFIASDGKGTGGYWLSANSQPNVAGYQQNNSTLNNPATIDNQNNNYYVQWLKSGAGDSPILSLCGVRVAYHAPLGVAAYLPAIRR
jgi:hypothetical protein